MVEWFGCAKASNTIRCFAPIRSARFGAKLAEAAFVVGNVPLIRNELFLELAA
jgi:hypothetical protein